MDGVEAVLLVGGLGTRLRPLTVSCPKPMLPVAGVPFVLHQLARARAAGVTRVVLATSYRPEIFAALGDGSDVGLELVHVHETEPLGTGGGIRNAAAALLSGPDDPVVIFNGDVLSGHDLRGPARGPRARPGPTSPCTSSRWRTRGPSARCPPTRRAGCSSSWRSPSTRRRGRSTRAATSSAARSSTASPTGRPVSVERETFPGLLAGGAVVQGYLESAYWLDLGTPAAYVRGSADVVSGAIASPALPGRPGDRLLLEGAVVAPDAAVTGGTVVGRGASVGAGAVVDGSVLQDGSSVAAGAVVRSSVVGLRSSVGARTVLDGVVVGDDARVGADCELLTGARVWTGAVLADGSVRFSSDA